MDITRFSTPLKGAAAALAALCLVACASSRNDVVMPAEDPANTLSSYGIDPSEPTPTTPAEPSPVRQAQEDEDVSDPEAGEDEEPLASEEEDDVDESDYMDDEYDEEEPEL